MERPATYLYCVVRAARRPATNHAPAGLEGASAAEALELGGGLWLIVAQVPLDIYGSGPLERALGNVQWVSDAALAHDAVIDFFSHRRGTTAVPMKMFTMFSSPAKAVAEMQARRDDLESVVDRIAGHEEWGVRVTREAAAAARQATAPASSGAAFLAAKKGVRDDRREAVRLALEAAEEAYTALAAVSAAVSRRDDVPQGAVAPPLLDAAFLVAAERRGRFKAAARQATARCRAAGATMVLTGPWPAYNFVQLPDRP